MLNLHDIEKKWGYHPNGESTEFSFHLGSLSRDRLPEAQTCNLRLAYKEAQDILQDVRKIFLEEHSSSLLILHDYLNWMIEHSLADGGPIVRRNAFGYSGFMDPPQFLFDPHNIPRLCMRAFDNVGFFKGPVRTATQKFPRCSLTIHEELQHIKKLIEQDAIVKKFLATEHSFCSDVMGLKIYVTSMQALLSQQGAMLAVLEIAGKRTAKKDRLLSYADSLSRSVNNTSTFDRVWYESKSKKLEMARALYYCISNGQDVTEVTRQIMRMRSRDLKKLVTTVRSLEDPAPTDLLSLSDEAFKRAVSTQGLYKYFSMQSDKERKALLIQRVDKAGCVDSLLTSLSALFFLTQLYGEKIADIVLLNHQLLWRLITTCNDLKFFSDLFPQKVYILLSNHQLILRLITTHNDLKFFLDHFPQAAAVIANIFFIYPVFLHNVMTSAQSSTELLWIATTAAAVQPSYRNRMLETILVSLDSVKRDNLGSQAVSMFYEWFRDEFPEYWILYTYPYKSFLSVAATKANIIEKSRVLHQAVRSPGNIFQKLEGCAAVIADIVAYTANPYYCTFQDASSLAYDHYNRPRTRVSQPRHYSLFRPSASGRPMLEIVAAAPLKP